MIDAFVKSWLKQHLPTIFCDDLEDNDSELEDFLTDVCHFPFSYFTFHYTIEEVKRSNYIYA